MSGTIQSETVGAKGNLTGGTLTWFVSGHELSTLFGGGAMPESVTQGNKPNSTWYTEGGFRVRSWKQTAAARPLHGLYTGCTRAGHGLNMGCTLGEMDCRALGIQLNRRILS